jgi:hypothetical protein
MFPDLDGKSAIDHARVRPLGITQLGQISED